jgi:hypothetical protein
VALNGGEVLYSRRVVVPPETRDRIGQSWFSPSFHGQHRIIPAGMRAYKSRDHYLGMEVPYWLKNVELINPVDSY